MQPASKYPNVWKYSLKVIWTGKIHAELNSVCRKEYHMVSQGWALWGGTGKTFSPSRPWFLYYSSSSWETESIGDTYYIHNAHIPMKSYRNGSCDYGSWKFLWPAICKLETQKSLRCNSVQVHRHGDQEPQGPVAREGWPSLSHENKFAFPLTSCSIQDPDGLNDASLFYSVHWFKC